MSSRPERWGTLAEKVVVSYLDKDPRRQWSRKVRRATEWIARRAVFDWLLGEREQFSDKPLATNGVQSIVVLQGLVFTTLAALLVYVQRAPMPQWRVSLIYLAISIIPIWQIVLISTARKGTPGCKRQFAFDRSAIMFGRWTAALLLLLVAGTVVAFEKELLPGQTAVPVPLTASRVDEYEFKRGRDDVGIRAGDLGIAIDIKLSPELLEKYKVPDPLVIDLRLGKAAQGWQIVSALGFVGDAADSERKTESPPMPMPSEDHFYKMIHWSALRPGRAYLLRVLLHRDGPSAPSLTDLMSRLSAQDTKDLDITAYFVK